MNPSFNTPVFLQDGHLLAVVRFETIQDFPQYGHVTFILTENLLIPSIMRKIPNIKIAIPGIINKKNPKIDSGNIKTIPIAIINTPKSGFGGIISTSVESG